MSPNNTCANCGKGEQDADSLKTCTACKMVKYCNRDCQIAHRPQHKKECKKRTAELREEEIFKMPPKPDCDICMIPLPTFQSGMFYHACCGKIICNGCSFAYTTSGVKEAILKGKSQEEAISKGMKTACPFCRSPEPSSDKELVERNKKRVDAGDVHAIFEHGCNYAKGEAGLPQDMDKALEFWQRAADLGHADANYNIGYNYFHGQGGLSRDIVKAKKYWVQSAIGGNMFARHNLAMFEGQAGNTEKAVKHYLIAVSFGDEISLNKIKELFRYGEVTKDDYTKALRTYQAFLDEVKSEQRDQAAAFHQRKYDTWEQTPQPKDYARGGGM